MSSTFFAEVMPVRGVDMTGSWVACFIACVASVVFAVQQARADAGGVYCDTCDAAAVLPTNDAFPTCRCQQSETGGI